MEAEHSPEPSEAHADARPEGTRRFGPWRRELLAFLELFALTGIAVAQPFFDVVSKNSELFVVRDTSGTDLILLALAVLLVPAVVLYAVEVIVGLIAPAARPYAHAVAAAVAIGLIALEVVKHQSELGPGVLIAIGVILGLLGGWLVWRYSGVRTWLRILAIAPPVFALLFLTSSSVSDIVFAGNVGAAHAAIEQPKPVVMLVMDEFPVKSLLDGNGQVDATLFPNFAELARHSTWYRNTTTVAPNTEAAVPAMLSGKMPKDPKAKPVASQHPDTLFTLLGGEYDMNVHEIQSDLCPTNICPPIDAPRSGESLKARASAFKHLVEDTTDLWWEFAGPDRAPEVTFSADPTVIIDPNAGRSAWRFLSSLEETDGGRLDFVHVILPHQPWHYLPGGQSYGAPDNPGFVLYGWDSEWAALSARQRHLLQLQYTDAFLGRLIKRMKALGTYDDSLLVVTADHGIAFKPKVAARNVSDQNQADISWVPLFIKEPGQTEGRVDDRPAFTVDILPTVADVLGIDVPWQLDGRSLRGRPRAEGARPMLDWDLNGDYPSGDAQFVQVDGKAGFEEVLHAQVSIAGGDPSLKLYRVGPYGGFVGEPVTALRSGRPSGRSASVKDAANWDDVDVDARYINWAFLEGEVDAPDGTQLAVAVNGRLAAFPVSYSDSSGAPSRYWIMVPPQLLHDGRNEITLYEVGGSTENPTLSRITVNR